MFVTPIRCGNGRDFLPIWVWKNGDLLVWNVGRSGSETFMTAWVGEM